MTCQNSPLSRFGKGSVDSQLPQQNAEGRTIEGLAKDVFWRSRGPSASRSCTRAAWPGGARAARPQSDGLASSVAGWHGLAGQYRTRIIAQIEQGDPTVAEQLHPRVYAGLRKLAADRLEGERGDLRAYAAAAIWKIDQRPAALRALLDELKEPQYNMPYAAVVTLGEIGPPAKVAIPDLMKTLSHETWYVREAVFAALNEIDPNWQSATQGP